MAGSKQFTVELKGGSRHTLHADDITEALGKAWDKWGRDGRVLNILPAAEANKAQGAAKKGRGK